VEREEEAHVFFSNSISFITLMLRSDWNTLNVGKIFASHMKDMDEHEYEGLQEKIRELKLPSIEVWTNKYPDREFEVGIFSSEFTSLCPKTGLPDFGFLRITYVPNENCIELKSFKEYIVAYRNLGIFYEHIANKILEDIINACKPRRAEIEIEFNPRGGITTTVKASFDEEKGFFLSGSRD
jgi:7-cyano-7-deazaguanine reductase